MSEDVGVNAPVTRLRRRLSVETEDAKSPAGTTTPTKKKGGRLATKPQLDLIKENDAEQVPKRSARKTAAKDIVEPVDDKPMTPSRRSARIRSNTSIVSETTQSLDSPRAKRAARRTSQAGSDNDGPATPARQTRRTRKDSTSSIDKQGDKVNSKTSSTPEIIVEEQENNNDGSSVKDTSFSKSPKGRGRKGKKNSLSQTANETETDNDIAMDNILNTSTKKDKQDNNDDSSESVNIITPSDNIKIDDNILKNKMNDIVELKEITSDIEKTKKRNSILHKSTSAIDDSKSIISKRHRTKSVSTLGKVDTDNSNEFNFFSDNEIYKKKKKGKALNISITKPIFSDNEINQSKKNKNDTSLTKLLNKDTENEAQETDANTGEGDLINNGGCKVDTSSENIKVNDKSMTLNNQSANNSLTKSGWKKNIINQIENMIDSSAKSEANSPLKCFDKEPSKDIQPTIIIDEDSDSNAGNNGQLHPIVQMDSEDQCVPVVNHNVHNDNEEGSNDKSYEPMDIDESVRQSTSIILSMTNSPRPSSQPEIQNQFSVSIDQGNDSGSGNTNKSKRKSSMSSSEFHNLEKSTSENKSTLILSQIKDTSGTEISEKTPKIDNKEQLSKSVNIPDKLKSKEAEKKKLSLDYSTSTPLQQKSMRKLGVSIDTSLISPKTKPKNKRESVTKEESIDNSKDHSEKEDESDLDDNLDESDDSREEATKTQNEIIDDEAEEASEDYESGDSQDEEEKQYERENEIVEKGETLDTDEEFSDDTDYERDSFVVSSDEEDNELLSGSGDDLSLSDNELSMSAKSKKKYNERKTKEQKKASREMYEARHKLDNSKKDAKKTKIKKNNRQRFESSSSESDKETPVYSKKTNRQRINSSQEMSDVKLDENESLMKKKKSKRLSESVCNGSVLNEQEITICNESKIETDDPISVAIKHEPKTPQRDNNLSAVMINDNIEEVNIDPNVTMAKPNEASDPLQATIQESDEDSESSEDNQEILKNYNSVLEDLNTTAKANKKHDISLNINKKQKKVKDPIVDQLNLTQVKTKKIKNKPDAIDTETQKQTKESNKVNENYENDGEESDSINMRLLFTEDSNDSVSNTEKTNGDALEANKFKDFIPLKKAEAKTNLLESIDISNDMNTSSNLNESKKKNKTRISSQNIPVQDSTLNEGDNNEGSFFIDTTGTRFDMDKPTDPSSSKKKKSRKSLCDTSILEVEEMPLDNDQNVIKKTSKKSFTGTENQTDEISVLTTNTPQSAKKMKKLNKTRTVTAEENETKIDEIDDGENFESSFFIDTVGTRYDGDEEKNSSKKKKNRNSDNNVIESEELPFKIDDSTSKKTPRKSLNSTGQQIDAEITIADEAADISTNTLGSTKKNKKGKKSLTVVVETETVDDKTEQDEPSVPVKTPQSGKKKNKSIVMNESINKSDIQAEKEMEHAVKTPQSQKKKNKSILVDQSLNKSSIQAEEAEVAIRTPQSQKKKNKSVLLDQSVNISTMEAEEVEVTVKTPQSQKKRNKSVLLDQSVNISTAEVQDELSVPIQTPQSEKKKNKSLLLDKSSNQSTIDEEKPQDQDIVSSSGKKKTKSKKSINNDQNELILIEDSSDVPTEVLGKSDKKRKSSLSNIETLNVIPLEYSKSDVVPNEISLNTSSNSANKKKLKSILNVTDSTKNTEETKEVNSNQSKEESSSKKRKRKHSATVKELSFLENENEENEVLDKLNESTTGSQRKKLKLTDNTEEVTISSKDTIKKVIEKVSNVETLEPKKIKKNKHAQQQNNDINEKETKVNQNKKRKERDDDILMNVSKILKQDSTNKAQVMRLPSHIINQLGEKPNKHNTGPKKTIAVATTEFKVEETRTKRNKPSSYLEESIYLNDDNIVEKNIKKYSIKKPKVLPFIPTASTSDSGFTTNFRINLLPRETQFVAQASNVVKFKNDFLQQQKIKKFRTFEKYKNQRNVKLSKF